MPTVRVRLYAELNDFVPPESRQRDLEVPLAAGATVKALIEKIGVPHTEVDLVLLNGEPARFAARPRDGDRLTVYPVFESWDIASVTLVRPHPLRELAFILDVHLGKLARLLRMLGFDAAWQRESDDDALELAAVRERRILLSRDRGLLKRSSILRGYCVRADDPSEQLEEVVVRFDLEKSARPFTRCLACGGPLAAVPVSQVRDQVPPLVARTYRSFSRCLACGKVYWRGTHARGMQEAVARALGRPSPSAPDASSGRHTPSARQGPQRSEAPGAQPKGRNNAR